MATPGSHKHNIEFAWRAHAAQENWTAKVDTKASIFFTVNGAGVAALVALRTQSGGVLEQLGGARQVIADVGIVLCALAVIIAGAAIFPLLGRSTRHRAEHDTIYFGHLRHRTPGEVAEQLRTISDDEKLDHLARQLVVMAKANWIKHRLLQLALLMALTGYATVLAVVIS
jgi:Family of unknown function (DUF5706)